MRTTRLLNTLAVCMLIIMQSCSKKDNIISSKIPLANTGDKLMTNVVATGQYKILSERAFTAGTSRYVGVVKASALQSAFVELRDYAENKGQDWQITSLGNGEYTITNIHSDKVLDVPYGVPNTGVQLWQYTKANPPGNAQKWRITHQGYGLYRIKSVLDTTKGLHIKDGATANGTKIVLKPFVSSPELDQKSSYFWLQPVTYSKNYAVLIGLPDTQSYSEFFPAVLTEQMNWIKAAVRKDSIAMVIQHGDLTNANIDAHWAPVNTAFHSLDNVVPYSLTTGNHDMSSSGQAADRNTTKFNTNFPYATMSGLPGFGGIYTDPLGANKMDNSYYLFETGPYKWVVINLEFGPRQVVIDWAKTICDQFADRTVIINTHCYMYSDNTTVGSGDSWSPHASYYLVNTVTDVNDGEELWNKLIRLKSNIRFVLSGHILNDGCGTLAGINDAGFKVYQLLANFQDGVGDAIGRGGDGYLRKYELNFTTKVLSVKTLKAATNAAYVDVLPGIDHNFDETNVKIVGMP